MTDREKTALVVGEINLPNQITRAINYLSNRDITLNYLTEVISEVTDQLVAEASENTEETDATS